MNYYVLIAIIIAIAAIVLSEIFLARILKSCITKKRLEKMVPCFALIYLLLIITAVAVTVTPPVIVLIVLLVGAAFLSEGIIGPRLEAWLEGAINVVKRDFSPTF